MEGLRMVKSIENDRGAAMVIQEGSERDTLFSEALPMLGFKMVTSDNGYDALQKFMSTPLTLIFADINVLGAWTLACHIKKMSPVLPAVVLIMEKQREDTLQMIKAARIDAVMVKPLGLADIRKIVGRFHAIDSFQNDSSPVSQMGVFTQGAVITA